MTLTPEHAAVADEAVVRLAKDDPSRSLRAFVLRAWDIVEPGTPLVWNWHLNLLCDELVRVPDEVQDLVINIPPGFMKSLLVSVLWPAWRWLQYPHERLLTFANKEDLASRDSRRMRTVIQSHWYKRLVHLMHKHHGVTLWKLAHDANEKVSFDNVVGDPAGPRDKGGEKLLGGRRANAIGSKLTGHRCIGMIIDDPLDAGDVAVGSPEQVRAKVANANDHIEKKLPTRMALPGTARTWRVIIMQRLHTDDAAGRALAKGARSIVLPMRYNPEHPYAYELDPRTAPGELLCPALADDAFDADIKDKLGPSHYAAQYDQSPVKGQGGLFRSEWFGRRFDFDAQRETKWDNFEIHIDATFKKGDDTDYVAIGAIGWKGGDMYVCHVINRRMSFVELKQALVDMLAMYPRTRAVVIEDKANGPALVSELEHARKARLPGTGHPWRGPVVAFNPNPWGSKYARAQVAAQFWEAGRCWLPSSAPWVDAWVDQHLTFPGGANDDMVDVGSQAWCRWTEGHGDGRSAVEALRARFDYLG